MLKRWASLDSLNPAQRRAVQIAAGPVLVIAGPGSGKTRVLTHRVAHLIKELGVPAYNIMAVTFTNKAARVMKQRLEELIGHRWQNLTIGTFHAICARMLRREAAHLGIDSNFIIYDEDDQSNVVKQALKDLKLDEKMYPPPAIRNAISRAKDELIGPEEYNPPTYWHEIAGRVYKRYQDILAANQALDFDDLLMMTVRLLRQHSDVRDSYQRRYVHILVDEFQDTNTAQYELVKLLAGKYRNLFVVGDPDQSIYAWRGANIRNIGSFSQDFPEAQTVLLEQNYRSTQTILDAAHQVISHNPGRHDKRLWTENRERIPLVVFEAYDGEEEADFVVHEIERLVSRGVCRAGECAVMYRTNAQSRALEDAFVRRGMPYKLVGATRFYERREIKDVLAYLRLIHNPYDDVSLRRIVNVPPRRIGSKALASLEYWASRLNAPIYTVLQLLAESDREQKEPTATTGSTENGSPSTGLDASSLVLPRRSFGISIWKALSDFLHLLDELLAAKQDRELVDLLDLVLERTEYAAHVRDGTEEGEERWRNIMELRSVAQEYGGLQPGVGLSSFLEEVALVSDVDNLNEEQDAPTLLTLHTAKGLEFRTVFIVGLEEGLLPHSRSFDNPEGMEEERRLCYVGITRAKERLYLTHTFRRTLYGAQSISEPSRFLRDIPDHLIQGRANQEAEVWNPSKKKPAAAPAMQPRGRERVESKQAISRREPVPATVLGPAFKPGDQVRHAQFGEGVVVHSEMSSGDEIVTVAFVGKGVKRLAASFAPLEKQR